MSINPFGPNLNFKLTALKQRKLKWMSHMEGSNSTLFDILASTYGIRSWTIENLEEYYKLNMLQDHLWKAYCSRSI